MGRRVFGFLFAILAVAAAVLVGCSANQPDKPKEAKVIEECPVKGDVSWVQYREDTYIPMGDGLSSCYTMVVEPYFALKEDAQLEKDSISDLTVSLMGVVWDDKGDFIAAYPLGYVSVDPEKGFQGTVYDLMYPYIGFPSATTYDVYAIGATAITKDGDEIQWGPSWDKPWNFAGVLIAGEVSEEYKYVRSLMDAGELMGSATISTSSAGNSREKLREAQASMDELVTPYYTIDFSALPEGRVAEYENSYFKDSEFKGRGYTSIVNDAHDQLLFTVTAYEKGYDFQYESDRTKLKTVDVPGFGPLDFYVEIAPYAKKANRNFNFADSKALIDSGTVK